MSRNSTPFPPGDVDDHLLAVSHATGIATFPDRSTGTANLSTLTDFTKEGGDISASYWTITINDGSVLWFKIVGTSKPSDAPENFQMVSTQRTVIGGNSGSKVPKVMVHFRAIE